MAFNPKAPLNRQQTKGNKRKILAILDSGLDVDYPLAVFFEGLNGPSSYTRTGQFNKASPLSEVKEHDLITVDLPHIKSYCNVYPNSIGMAHPTQEAARKQGTREVIAILLITFDPNNNTSTSEVVYEYQ